MRKNIITTKLLALIFAGTLSVFNAKGQTSLSGNAAASNACTPAANDGGIGSNTSVGCGAGKAGMTGTENTFVGNLAGTSITTGSANVAMGYKAGNALITGTNCTFVGANSGLNTTGINNTFLGSATGETNSTGTNNTMIGTASGYLAASSNNTFLGFGSGYNCGVTDNVAVGVKALFTLAGSYLWGTAGSDVAVGNYALYNNVSYDNSAIGDHALYNNSTGIENSALGNSAGYYNTTGSNNTFVGYNTGYTSSSTGSQNTFVGDGAYENGDYSNSSAIGYGAEATQSNEFVAGNSSITESWVFVDWTIGSDSRVKKDVKETVPGIKFIQKLRPVTYHYDMNQMASILQTPDKMRLKDAEAAKEKILYSGFIAQEVEKAAQDVGYDFNGVDKPQNDKSMYGLRYSEFVVPTVKAMQEQQAMIEDQQKQIAQLTQLVNAMGGLNNTGDATANRQAVQLGNSTAVVLNQNVPNPFAEQTLINYSIPQTAAVAQILFYDMAGQLIKTTDITTRGAGQLNVFANDLSNGSYSYTLVVDGKIIDTKKMVKQ